MTALSRTSKGCGFTGTVVAHGVLLFVFLLFADRATPTPLPPPVEAVRISLTEAVAAPAPEPEQPVPPQEIPEAPPPPVVEEKTTIVEKTPVQPKKVEPRKQPPRPKVQPQKTAAPARPANAKSVPAPNPVVKEARQTVLSALIARIEKEKRYPTSARRLGLEGQLTVVVRVDAQGRIASVSVRGEGTHAILEKATSEAMNRVRGNWKPVPVPEAMTLHVPIRYTLS